MVQLNLKNRKIKLILSFLTVFCFLSCEDHTIIKESDYESFIIKDHSYPYWNKLFDENYEHKYIDQYDMKEVMYLSEEISFCYNHKNFLKNQRNRVELQFYKIYYVYNKHSRSIKDRVSHRFFVGYDNGNFNSITKESHNGYLIGWSNKIKYNEINKCEISEATDTIISTLNYEIIKKLYPSFKGIYQKVKIDSIVIPKLDSYTSHYINLENIKIYGNHQWFKYNNRFFYIE